MDQLPPPLDWQTWLADRANRFLVFARDQTRSEADAQDVLQEALVEAWRRHDDPHGAPPDALVFSTIRRRAIDQARSNDRRKRRDAVALESEPEWFEPAASQDSVIDNALEVAVKALPPTQREVVTLKIWGELTFQEIADALGIPSNTAASRYRYALEQMRGILASTTRDKIQEVSL